MVEHEWWPLVVDANATVSFVTAAPWYLGIDLGTGGAKVAAVGPDGSIRTAAFASIDTVLTADGGAEQDPRAWWTAIVDTTRQVL